MIAHLIRSGRLALEGVKEAETGRSFTKLISRKDPIEILVIDRVDKTPTEN